MKKRLVSVLLCAAMTATLLAGCGGSSDSEGESGSGSEIYMFISQPEYADAINALIEEYKTVEPDVTINYETTQNDYPTLLKAKLNSGEAPDIFSSTSGKEIETYKEYSADLTGEPLVEAMDPNVAEAMKDANGEGCYGFAIKGNYFGLLYNQDLLDEAGVDKIPETVSELEDCVQKLKDAGITPFTSGYSEWWVFKHIFQHFAAASTDDYAGLVAGMEAGTDSIENYPLLTDNFFNFVDLVKDNGDAKPLETDLSAELSAFASGSAAIMVGQGAWVEGAKMSKLLIVIPAHNEEANIVQVVEELTRGYPQYDYVVVNDGSRDKTAALCRAHGYRLIDLPVNLGLAGAFQTGLRFAAENGYDCAMQMDADGQHKPEYIAPMLAALEEGNDIVIGSRFLTVKKPKTLRMLGSYIISWSIRLTTGRAICDPTSGMRLFNRAMVEEFAQNLNYGPEPDTISYLIKNGAVVREVQVTMGEREAGQSYLTFWRSIEYMVKMSISILLIQWFRKRDTETPYPERSL